MAYAIGVNGKSGFMIVEPYEPRLIVNDKNQRYIDWRTLLNVSASHPESRVSNGVTMLFIFKYSKKLGLDSAEWIGVFVMFTNDAHIYVETKGATAYTKNGAGYYMVESGKLNLMNKKDTEHYSARVKTVFKKLGLI